MEKALENPLEDPAEEPLHFFNYHEFVILSNHELLQNPNIPKSLVITHFPNNHVALDSSSYSNTRIVRIPRIYETAFYSDIIPQFSTYTPGSEPAALNHMESDSPSYEMVGKYDDNFFGETSITPLTPFLLDQEELLDIVTTINTMIYTAFNPYNFWNFLDNLLDFLTATLYGYLATRLMYQTHSKRWLSKLENYINQTNAKLSPRNVKIISPRRTAYLSLDIQIMKPTPSVQIPVVVEPDAIHTNQHKS